MRELFRMLSLLGFFFVYLVDRDSILTSWSLVERAVRGEGEPVSFVVAPSSCQLMHRVMDEPLSFLIWLIKILSPVKIGSLCRSDSVTHTSHTSHISVFQAGDILILSNYI